MSASWPTSVASDSTLYLAVNELQNNLSGAVNSAVTTLGLNSTTGFPTVGLVLIDNEVIKYTGVSGNNLTGCTRAFDGTTAAAHSSAAVVSFAFCAAHHNNLKDEIIAIETSLNLTASKALSTDTNGRVAVATTTLAELNFVSGVTSAIQTQLNAKAPTASPTFTGTIGTPLTVSKALQTDGSGNLQASAVTTTELGYVSGVTSAIQTQLNAATSKYFQTVQATSTTQTATTSSTYQSTSLTATITPSSSSHRIKITISGDLNTTAAGTSNAVLSIKRGSTELSASGQGFAVASGQSGALYISAGVCYVDSPATASAVTYTAVLKSTDNATNVRFGNAAEQVMILEEIA